MIEQNGEPIGKKQRVAGVLANQIHNKSVNTETEEKSFAKNVAITINILNLKQPAKITANRGQII